MKFEADIFSKFDKEWALLSAGPKDNHNSMTIAWGGMGTLWSKPVITVYVKPCRYTYEFMNRNEYFTVSFYGSAYRKALGIMGSKSGRDTDKDTAAGLTVKELGEAVTYEQAEATLLCRKIYWQDLDPATMPPDVVEQFYTTEEPHRMYIGEVVKIL